jgi:hypothetical protein
VFETTARRVRRIDRALVDRPRGARVRLAQLLEDLDIGRQVELAAAERARDGHVVEPGIGQRFEERARQLALGLDLVGGGSDLGGQLAGGIQQRSGLGSGHGVCPGSLCVLAWSWQEHNRNLARLAPLFSPGDIVYAGRAHRRHHSPGGAP